jgi:S1-C subfamily serine protease
VIKGAYHAEIKTSNGKSYPVKEIIAKDIDGDLVRLSVDIPGNEVRALPVNHSIPDACVRVIVLGNPLVLENTVSEGIVSAIRGNSRIWSSYIDQCAGITRI